MRSDNRGKREDPRKNSKSNMNNKGMADGRPKPAQPNHWELQKKKEIWNLR